MKTTTETEYAVIMTDDTLGLYDFISINDDCIVVSEEGKEITFNKPDIIELCVTSSLSNANVQLNGMAEDSQTDTQKEPFKYKEHTNPLSDAKIETEHEATFSYLFDEIQKLKINIQMIEKYRLS